jgi:hypothetical protein
MKPKGRFTLGFVVCSPDLRANLLAELCRGFHQTMAILDFILGRPLASDEDKDERVGSVGWDFCVRA